MIDLFLQHWLSFASTFIYLVAVIYLLVKKRYDLFIFLVALASMVEIFNNVVFFAITALKIAGLAVVPYSVRRLFEFAKLTPARFLIAASLLFVPLAIVHGVIWPWPYYSGTTAFQHAPIGRSILALGTYGLEFSFIIFLTFELGKEKNFRYLIYGIIFGGVLCSLGLYLEKYGKIDLYYHFAGHDARELSVRPRGFNYEPRGAAYSGIVALVALLLPSQNLKLIYRLLISIVVFSGLYLSASFSGLIMFVITFGLIVFVSLVLYKFFKEQVKTILILAGFVVVAGIVNMLIFNVKVWQFNFKSKKAIYIESSQQIDKFPMKNKKFAAFEIFDAAALDFFDQNPEHLIFGTGAGLISNAASVPERRIIGVPHIGLLLQISQYGLVGTLLWLIALFLIFKKLLMVALEKRGHEFTYDRLIFFAALICLYGLQAKYFYVFGLGSGLAYYRSLES